MYTAGAKIGHGMNVCELEVNRRGYVIFSTFLISSVSKMLESTSRSNLYNVCNWRLGWFCKRVLDLDFQGYAMKIKKNKIFIITVGFLDPENIPMKNTPLDFSVGEIHWVSEGKKFKDEKSNERDFGSFVKIWLKSSGQIPRFLAEKMKKLLKNIRICADAIPIYSMNR